MTALVLYPMAVGLMLVGAVLAWPIARRVGERQPDRLHWEPITTRDSAGRRWVPVPPRPARVSLRARAAGWWVATAPRDPHTTVRLAMVGTGRSWMDGATA
jgi:hypothetical protein